MATKRITDFPDGGPLQANDVLLISRSGTTYKALGATVQPYDIGVFVGGVPGAGERVVQWAAPRAVTIPENFTGSVAVARVSATGAASFDVRKNDFSVGTIFFGAGSATGAFTSSAGVSLAVGDLLSIVAPGTADTTLADISITFAGAR